jgi:RNA polymerase sigma factor (sigma-70 family)
MWDPGPEGFTTFFEFAEPRLRRALVAVHGGEAGRDAAAEALAYGWQNWERVRTMENAVGYLYRVGQSRARPRRERFAPVMVDERADGWFEPELPAAMERLSERERLAVVLVEGYGWTHRETAELAGVTTSSIQSYLARGLEKLRAHLGVSDRG